MKKITYKEIMSLNPRPCYDPAEIGMPKDYEADILDCIKEYRYKVKQPQDILWVVVRAKYLSDKILRLFAVACAKEAIKLIKNPDPRSLKAIEVAEKFAYGHATKEELGIAYASASAASAVFAVSASVAAASAATSAATSASADSADSAYAYASAYASAAVVASVASASAVSASAASAYDAVVASVVADAREKQIDILVGLLTEL